jgi:inositol transport system substrate-binding protein
LLIFLALLLVCGCFTACASPSNEQSPGTSADAPSDTPNEESTPPENGDVENTGDDKVIKVGYVDKVGSDEFCYKRYQALVNAISNEEKPAHEIDLSYSDANDDMQASLDLTDNYLSQGVDILILVAVDGEAIVPAIEKANQQGIPVLCYGIKAGGGEYTFVGSDNFDAGYMQGELFAQMLPENAKILYLAGRAGLQHSVDRREGLYAAFKDAGREDIETLADMDGDYKKEMAMQIMEDWIQAYPEFDAVIAANDLMALGAIEAMKIAGIDLGEEGVLVSGIDGLPDSCAAIKEGVMIQSILQDADGQALECLKGIHIMADGDDPGPELLAPFLSITKENVDQYL